MIRELIRENKGRTFLEKVLQSKNELEEKDSLGRTVLVEAFQLNRYFHAKILLDNGADPSVVWENNSIVNLAIQGKHIEMIRLASTYQPGMEALNHVSQKCLQV